MKESKRFRIITIYWRTQKHKSRKNASKNQIEEVKIVLAAVQKKEEQATPTPYRHPNYNRQFDQR